MSDQKVDVYMPLYVRDFLTSTIGWTAEERGHYLTLLMIQWDRGSLPGDLESLERLSPGIGRVWGLLAEKFPQAVDGEANGLANAGANAFAIGSANAGANGRLMNQRLEEHRQRCIDLKERRAESGRRGASARWAGQNQPETWQNDGKRMAEPLAKTWPPTSTSTSTTSSLREEVTTHTHAADAEFRNPGWAATEWQGFVARWNATERAQPWTPLLAPAGWVDHASSPGWLSMAYEAMERLPRCEFFDRPLAVTRFFGYVDRILAGEFDQAKADRGRRRQTAGGNL